MEPLNPLEPGRWSHWMLDDGCGATNRVLIFKDIHQYFDDQCLWDWTWVENTN